jgi:1-acyl-sn-glycerol-3-phosphate acyltransferase
MIPQIDGTGKTPCAALTHGHRLPLWLAAGVAWAVRPTLRGEAGRRRSFARDVQWAVRGMRPQPHILGTEHIPPRGPCLVLCNHYSREGLGVWWGVLALSAAIAEHRAPGTDPEVRWVITAAWTFPGWKRRFLTPLTRWAFARAAQVYGFIPMPPMPPDPDEVEARAAAVLRTVRLARQIASRPGTVGTGGMIGLAPEGQDMPGAFGQLPPGAGAFVALLVEAGLPVLPVGVGERAGELYVSFGPPFTPHIPAERARRDPVVAQQIVSAIRQCLPS